MQGHVVGQTHRAHRPTTLLASSRQSTRIRAFVSSRSPSKSAAFEARFAGASPPWLGHLDDHPCDPRRCGLREQLDRLGRAFRPRVEVCDGARYDGVGRHPLGHADLHGCQFVPLVCGRVPRLLHGAHLRWLRPSRGQGLPQWQPHLWVIQGACPLRPHRRDNRSDGRGISHRPRRAHGRDRRLLGLWHRASFGVAVVQALGEGRFVERGQVGSNVGRRGAFRGRQTNRFHARGCGRHCHSLRRPYRRHFVHVRRGNDDHMAASVDVSSVCVHCLRLLDIDGPLQPSWPGCAQAVDIHGRAGVQWQLGLARCAPFCPPRRNRGPAECGLHAIAFGGLELSLQKRQDFEEEVAGFGEDFRVRAVRRSLLPRVLAHALARGLRSGAAEGERRV
mmetsp:Transcript_43101/g.119209  ORF Transcript_43101/g.119209 Transcript_43101/m.119209 type:complete len:391 (+) Transcript_43101:205-1377(+)